MSNTVADSIVSYQIIFVVLICILNKSYKSSFSMLAWKLSLKTISGRRSNGFDKPVHPVEQLKWKENPNHESSN